MSDSNRLEQLEHELATVRSAVERLSYTVTLLCRRTETGAWLSELTEAERAHWSEKSESDKDWWFANTQPRDRAQLLRTEIGAAAAYKKLQELPQSDRDAILERLDSAADAARKRLRARGFGS